MTDATPATDDRPLLTRARASMPGLTAAETALDAVSERLLLARAVPRHEVDTVVDAALPALLAGDPLSGDLASRVLAQRRLNESALAESAALAELERRLRQAVYDLHRTRADDALGVLHTELHDLLGRSRPVLAELGDITTAEQAIDGGKVDQWQAVGTEARRYGELRDAQRVLVSAALDPPLPPARPGNRITRECRILVDDYGHVSAAHLHGPVGLGTPGTTRTEQVRIRDGRAVTNTSTAGPTTVRPWLTGDTLADLRFISRPDLQPWVPTVAELTTARDEHGRRLAEAARAAAEPPRSRLGRLGGPTPPRAAEARETAS